VDASMSTGAEVRQRGWVPAIVAAAALLALDACGNGGSSSIDLAGTGPEAAAQAVIVPSSAEASRFLAQATFGPTPAEIQRLAGMSLAAWMEDQFAKPQTLH